MIISAAEADGRLLVRKQRDMLEVPAEFGCLDLQQCRANDWEVGLGEQAQEAGELDCEPDCPRCPIMLRRSGTWHRNQTLDSLEVRHGGEIVLRSKP